MAQSTPEAPYRSVKPDKYAERASMAVGRAGDGFRTEAIFYALLWRRSVAYGKTAAGHVRLRRNLEIILRPEIADFQLAQADDTKCWRFHPPDANDASAFC